MNCTMNSTKNIRGRRTKFNVMWADGFEQRKKKLEMSYRRSSLQNEPREHKMTDLRFKS